MWKISKFTNTWCSTGIKHPYEYYFWWITYLYVWWYCHYIYRIYGFFTIIDTIYIWFETNLRCRNVICTAWIYNGIILLLLFIIISIHIPLAITECTPYICIIYHTHFWCIRCCCHDIHYSDKWWLHHLCVASPSESKR